MMQLSLVGIRRSVVAAAAVWAVAGGGVANAAEFVTNWDPIFNPAFTSAVPGNPNLGWKGSASVTVDDGCLIGLAGPRMVGSGGCASATLNSFTLDFYNGTPTSSLGSVSGAGSLPGVFQLLVDGFGGVIGMDLTGPIVIPGTSTFNSIAYSRMLDFTIAPFVGPTLTLTVACFACEFPPTYQSATEGVNAPVSTWALVPEPTSLALVGLALAALGLRRRRA